MKISYDKKHDILRVLFSNSPIADSDEENPGIIMDFDKDRNLVGMEILDASKRVDHPEAVELALTA